LSALRQFLVSTPAVQTDENVLFAFDDYAIPWHHNTKVTLMQAQKHPANPVLRSGPPARRTMGMPFCTAAYI
jgi:hypothetical protein